MLIPILGSKIFLIQIYHPMYILNNSLVIPNMLDQTLTVTKTLLQITMN